MTHGTIAPHLQKSKNAFFCFLVLQTLGTYQLSAQAEAYATYLRRRRNSLNLEMRAKEQRPRSNERARRQRLREIRAIDRIEPVEQRHIRTKNLHVDEILHRQVSFLERRAKSVHHQPGLLLDVRRNSSRRQIKSQVPGQIK